MLALVFASSTTLAHDFIWFVTLIFRCCQHFLFGVLKIANFKQENHRQKSKYLSIFKKIYFKWLNQRTELKTLLTETETQNKKCYDQF